MKASVIIPTYNRREILKKVLKEFFMQKGTDDNFDLIVVDDGSTDGTSTLFDLLNETISERLNLSNTHNKLVEKIKIGRLDQVIGYDGYLANPAIKYVKIEKSGRSVARNIGMELSSSDLIIFSDDDIFVEKNYICKHIQSHYPEDKLVVMGKVINTEDLENPFSAKWKLRDINTAFLATGNASILKKYIEEAGGFDENYKVYGWEDFDLGVHLNMIGLKSIKKPIYAYHYNPVNNYIDPDALYRKEMERGITAVYFYINHPLPWVKKFTLVENKLLPSLVDLFTKRMLDKYRQKKVAKLRGMKRLLFRYKAYFDGVKEGKNKYE